MLREHWNSGWLVTKPGENPLMAMMGADDPSAQLLTLPHDAMIHEHRRQDTKNQHQTGFYPGGCYTYTKVFETPKEWEEKTVMFEFEGVYENGRVYINGDYAGGCPNGYTEFMVCADDFLKFGEQNTVTVIANTSPEENTRWYSGSGIYRNVNLLVGNFVHVKENSLKVTTPEIDKDLAVAVVEFLLVNRGTKRKKVCVNVEILDAQRLVVSKNVIPVTLFAGAEEPVCTRLQVEYPLIWDCDDPNLYTCVVRIEEVRAQTEPLLLQMGEIPVNELDLTEETFGFRTLSLSAKKGFRLNGREVKLRGACVHHDNGVIGAVTLERAEERRVQQLKAAGFNCLRSSHHPMSRAMLAACDREGMLVLDELADCWTRSKNNNDYAEKFSEYWERDVEAMVNKDYNHPCVILYISGNEIQEAATGKGAQMNRKIQEKIHTLDHTRYVTVAINGLLACMDHIGEVICDITGMTMEQMMAMQAQAAEQPQSDAGADAANGSTDLMKGPMADAFAANHIVKELLDESASVRDLTGYNYLTARHEMEHTLNPNRVILGTETLPSDLVRLWGIVKRNPHVIGDMTWTGYDYLGEAGSGTVYYDGRTGFMPNWPISLAEMGDINLIGIRRPISYFREIVFGRRTAPYIVVERVNHYGQRATHSAWPWKDELASWTWHGYEGKGAIVNVYSSAEEIELFLNGRSLGRKGTGEENGYFASFEVVYEPGTLRAVNYTGDVAGETVMLSTAKDCALCLQPDRTELKADGADLCYLMIGYKDSEGTFDLWTEHTVTVTVEGAGSLQGMGSADPATENSYDNHCWDTYDGAVLAVIRAGCEPGEIKVTVTDEQGAEKILVMNTGN